MKQDKITKIFTIKNNLPWVDYRKYNEETKTWGEWKKFKKQKAKYKNVEYRTSEIDRKPTNKDNNGWPISTNTAYIKTRENALTNFDFNLDLVELNDLLKNKYDISFLIKPGTRVKIRENFSHDNYAESWCKSLQGATVTIKHFKLPVAMSNGNFPAFYIMEDTRTGNLNVNNIISIGEVASANDIEYYKTVKIGAQPAYESTGNPNFYFAH